MSLVLMCYPVKIEQYSKDLSLIFDGNKYYLLLDVQQQQQVEMNYDDDDDVV